MIRIHAALRHLVAAFALAGLAACDTPVEQWQPVEAPKTNQVELVRLSHTVKFQPGAATLPPAETRRLMSFIEESEIEGGEEIRLGAAPGDSLAQARQTAVRKLLAQRGIRTAPLPVMAAAPADGVMLQIERYVVTPPACPNWSKPPGGDPTNTTASNFGCATATNLGLMVADPRDLLYGRKPGPPDAEPALRAIQNYRAGKPINLPDDLTSSSSPGSSGAGPGSSASGGSGGGSSSGGN